MNNYFLLQIDIQPQLNVEYVKVFEFQETWLKN